MKSFSMWEFPNINNIERVIELLGQNLTNDVAIDWNDAPLRSEITPLDGFSIVTPETIEIENSAVRYIYFEARTERARREDYWYDVNQQLKDRQDRVTPYQANILFFEYNDTVKCIAFVGKSRANNILTDNFKSEVWGDFEVSNSAVTDDLLYWLFKRYIDIPDDPLSNVHPMYVTGLKSYAGKTRDNANAVRGDGSRISTILGTLAFLFNNENLKAVRPQIQINGEVVLLELTLSGTFKFSETDYQGRFLGRYNGDRLHNAVSIYIFIFLIPTIVECYRENVARGSWSPQFKVDFLKRLGEEIKRRVETELIRIEEAIDQEQAELIEVEDENDELTEIDDLNNEDN